MNCSTEHESSALQQQAARPRELCGRPTGIASGMKRKDAVGVSHPRRRLGMHWRRLSSSQIKIRPGDVSPTQPAPRDNNEAQHASSASNTGKLNDSTHPSATAASSCGVLEVEEKSSCELSEDQAAQFPASVRSSSKARGTEESRALLKESAQEAEACTISSVPTGRRVWNSGYCLGADAHGGPRGTLQHAPGLPCCLELAAKPGASSEVVVLSDPSHLNGGNVQGPNKISGCIRSYLQVLPMPEDSRIQGRPKGPLMQTDISCFKTHKWPCREDEPTRLLSVNYRGDANMLGGDGHFLQGSAGLEERRKTINCRLSSVFEASKRKLQKQIVPRPIPTPECEASHPGGAAAVVAYAARC